MNGKDLFAAMSFIDEALVHESETARPAHRHPMIWAALAACLCLAVFLLYPDPVPQQPQEVTVPAAAGGYIATDPPQDPITAAIPQQTPTYSVLLTVEALTEDGFTAAVADPLESGLPPDAVLHVVLDEALQPEPGSTVLVRFTDYDEITHTLQSTALEEKG